MRFDLGDVKAITPALVLIYWVGVYPLLDLGSLSSSAVGLNWLGVGVVHYFAIVRVAEIFRGTSRTDLQRTESLALAPLILLIFWIGLYPNAFLKPMQPAVDDLIVSYHRKLMTTNMDDQTRLLPPSAPAQGEGLPEGATAMRDEMPEAGGVR
jgi:NADH-quinone oxidoreductase subunit M